MALDVGGDSPLSHALSLQPEGSTTVRFDVAGLGSPTAEAPWFVSLTSEMVLPSQSIRLANAIDGDAPVQVR